MTTQVPPHAGEVLREILEQRGISQIQAADSLGMSRGHLNSIINGHNPISSDLKFKLQDLLDIPTHHWTKIQDKHHLFIDSDEGRHVIQKTGQHALIQQLELKSYPQLLRDEIVQAEACKWLVIEPFDSQQLTRTGYWMTLGKEGTVCKRFDPKPNPLQTSVELDPEVALKPGEILTLLTRERLHLPQGLHARVATIGDSFINGELSIHCRLLLESGFGTSMARPAAETSTMPKHGAGVSLSIVNETARPQIVRFQQQAIHLQFDFIPEDDHRGHRPSI